MLRKADLVLVIRTPSASWVSVGSHNSLCKTLTTYDLTRLMRKFEARHENYRLSNFLNYNSFEIICKLQDKFQTILGSEYFKSEILKILLMLAGSA